MSDSSQIYSLASFVEMCRLLSPLIHLSIICVLSFQTQTQSSDGIPKCGGVEIQDFEDTSLPCRAQVPHDLDPAHFDPFQTLYLPLSITNQDSRAQLESAFLSVNHEMEKLLTGPTLSDIRLPRSLTSNGAGCEKPLCSDRLIPSEYVMPCYVSTFSYVEEKDSGISQQPSEHVKDLNSLNRSLVIYIHIRDASKTGKSPCDDQNVLAFATVCGFESEFFRPTHGGIVLCKQPEQIDEDLLHTVILHETLHIMTVDLFGSYFFENSGRQAKNMSIEILRNSSRSRSWWKTGTLRWLDEHMVQSELSTAMTTTDLVSRFISNHFHCKETEGAEVGILINGNRSFPDPTHWSMRLFPEEILSPYLWPKKVLSNLTLSYLKDSKWYDVRWPNVQSISRPSKENGCQVAKRSCHEIFGTLKKTRGKIENVGPYCDLKNVIKTPKCSQDGLARLSCQNFGAMSNGCPINYVATNPSTKNDDYDHSLCTEATRQPSALKQLGFDVGRDTICVTMVTSPSNIPLPFPACIGYTCGKDTIELILRPKNGVVCRAECHKNTSTITFTKGECPQGIEVLCPAYEAVCLIPARLLNKIFQDEKSIARVIPSLGKAVVLGAMTLSMSVLHIWY